MSNIVPIDYDAGISEVNQINRIKLMLTNAVKNMNKSTADKSVELSNMEEAGCLDNLQGQEI